MFRGIVVFSLGAALLAVSLAGADAASDKIALGKYLVEFGGCNDCYTPGNFLGKPDMNRYLGGSDVAFANPDVPHPAAGTDCGGGTQIIDPRLVWSRAA